MKLFRRKNGTLHPEYQKVIEKLGAMAADTAPNLNPYLSDELVVGWALFALYALMTQEWDQERVIYESGLGALWVEQNTEEA